MLHARRFMRTPIVLLALCVVAAPAIVLAQSAQEKADAEVLFNAGKAALAAGNLNDACPKFAESQKKDPAIGTALYLAECYERTGKMASAWAEFRQAEDMANQRHDNRAPVAKARADRLVPSKLTIVLAPGADAAGLEVKRDNEVVAGALFGLASPIDGGRHVIIATAPGRKAFEWSGEVAEQRGVVTVTIPKLEESRGAPIASATGTASVPTATATTTATAAPTTTSTPPPDTGGGMSGGKIAGLVIGGVGLVALGVGTTLGVVAKGNYDSATGPASGCNAATGVCLTQSGADALSSAKGLADISTGVFIGGAVALVAGVVIFFVSPKKSATTSALTLTPLVGSQGGGAVLSGRF